jgi:hypothetical protein
MSYEKSKLTQSFVYPSALDRSLHEVSNVSRVTITFRTGVGLYPTCTCWPHCCHPCEKFRHTPGQEDTKSSGNSGRRLPATPLPQEGRGWRRDLLQIVCTHPRVISSQISASERLSSSYLLIYCYYHIQPYPHVISAGSYYH